MEKIANSSDYKVVYLKNISHVDNSYWEPVGCEEENFIIRYEMNLIEFPIFNKNISFSILWFIYQDFAWYTFDKKGDIFENSMEKCRWVLIKYFYL